MVTTVMQYGHKRKFHPSIICQLFVSTFCKSELYKLGVGWVGWGRCMVGVTLSHRYIQYLQKNTRHCNIWWTAYSVPPRRNAKIFQQCSHSYPGKKKGTSVWNAFSYLFICIAVGLLVNPKSKWSHKGFAALDTFVSFTIFMNFHVHSQVSTLTNVFST